MKKSLLSSVLAGAAVAALALAPNTAAAQVSAPITATAQVQTALTVSATNNLDFGSVYPGAISPTVVAPTAATAGSFLIAGATNAQLTVSFTLPANLTNGANNLPITFSTTSASYSQANTQGTATPFDPSTILTTNLDATTGDLYVWIGGSVTATTQPAGTYTAPITLTAQYTGN